MKLDCLRMGRAPSAYAVAAMFGVPVESVRKQYRKNAVQLRSLEAKARLSGKRVRGYTADELAGLAQNAEDKAT